MWILGAIWGITWPNAWSNKQTKISDNCSQNSFPNVYPKFEEDSAVKPPKPGFLTNHMMGEIRACTRYVLFEGGWLASKRGEDTRGTSSWLKQVFYTPSTTTTTTDDHPARLKILCQPKIGDIGICLLLCSTLIWWYSGLSFCTHASFSIQRYCWTVKMKLDVTPARNVGVKFITVVRCM